jgi:hypothetical protein
MKHFRVSQWLADASGIASRSTFSEQYRLYWLFEVIRVVSLIYVLLFFVHLLAPSCFRRYEKTVVLSFYLYIALSCGIGSVLYSGVFTILNSSLTMAQVAATQGIVTEWMCEAVLAWSCGFVFIILRRVLDLHVVKSRH